MMTDTDRLRRLFDLRMRSAAGTLTPAEQAELERENEWAMSYYGIGVSGAGESTPENVRIGAEPPATGGEDDMADAVENMMQGGRGGGASVDIPGVAPGTTVGKHMYDNALQYDSFQDFIDASVEQLSNPEVSMLVSAMTGAPLTAIATMGKQIIDDIGRDRSIERTDKVDQSFADAPVGSDMRGGPSGDRGASASTGAAQSDTTAAAAGRRSAFSRGSRGDRGGLGGTPSGPAGGNFGDYGGRRGFRHGGYIRPDGDDRMEPVDIRAHETEYVLRPEAVEAIGVPTLEILNNMRPRRGRGLFYNRAQGRIDQLDQRGMT